MQTPTSLRLLAFTNNARGDLFTRLVKDLFFALGYDGLQLDVHTSGREIDIQGTHRLEPRRLVAECKAHAEKMGGAELNKFFGVVGRERDKDERIPVAAYFVSLSGFRETGKRQEEETSQQKRTILLDAKQVIEELTRIRILVTHTEAAERAGRCAEHAGLKEAVLDGVELLGHELGYLWAVFYAHGKQRTHFALIHADGTPLAESITQGVPQADRECNGSLHSLKYLAPPAPGPDREALARASVERYRRWVLEECGHIQLDGLPADADLSALRMKLERLFVPLKIVTAKPKPADEKERETGDKSESIVPVGDFLDSHSRFSLLARPGGGKSTLLKRLASAYAASERRAEIDDRLPERDWLPLLLRCRELRDRAHRPIRELLDDLPQYAGMTDDEAAVFRDQIDAALRSGRVLLLIDGLDEISQEGARTTFAGHLRTFLAIFPHTAMIVTSREAGYRHVAGVIASACEQVSLAPFDEDDVRRLCESWHVEVVGDNDRVRSEARQLAATIWNNERIRALAENPLMLTTLLVVRRCIGELPNRRVELYWEAVRVLIRTWNTEGFDPMDLEETLAQLSYVACTMMNEGIQQIGHRRLLKLLRDARDELQAELQFSRVAPEEFIERIEYRSSLLMQTGHERIDGELQPVYEFRHLTFQEYLAARGLVEEQYPGRDSGQSLVDLLERHFEDERWREVIPLAAVLAGRKAEPLIKRLTAACEARKRLKLPAPLEDVGDPRVMLLRQCLLDDVQVTPPTLRAALQQMARHSDEEFVPGSVSDLRRGKFGEVFQEVVEEAYFSNTAGWDEYQAVMVYFAQDELFHSEGPQLSDVVSSTLDGSLKSGNRKQQTRAAFVCVWLAYWKWRERERRIVKWVRRKEDESLAERFHPLRDALGDLLAQDDPPLALAAAWALAWMGRVRLPDATPEPCVMMSLYRLWREADSSALRRYAAWAFATQPLLPRDTFAPDVWGDCDAWLQEAAFEAHKVAPLVLAWYRRTPWSDSGLAEKLSEIGDHSYPTVRELLATLGESGQRVLEQWEAEKKKR
ncbi:MAG: NACHT domain-containing protein [Pirellulaceae bacterium]|nr:NACHT domain-containing protein [Pirellulaceae bacterium]